MSVDDEVVALVRDLTDPKACVFDHRGHCAAHGWTADEPRCPHVRAREFLMSQKWSLQP